MAKWVIDSSTLTGIADSVREQTGTEDSIPVTDLASMILGISGGGGGGMELPAGVYIGEFSLLSDVTGSEDIEIDELPNIPYLIGFTTKNKAYYSSARTSLGGIRINNAGSYYNWMNDYQGYINGSMNATAIDNISTSGFTVKPRSSGYPLRSGDYIWFAICTQ